MNIKTLILCVVSLIAVFITFNFVEPVPQDPRYHHFGDSRKFLGIPNALDVLSNIPLIIVGLIALILLMYKFPDNYLPYIIALTFFYALSRLTETFDREIFETLRFISGHTSKHLFAAAAAYCVLRMLQKRAQPRLETMNN